MKHLLLSLALAAGLTASAQSTFDGQTIFGYNFRPTASISRSMGLTGGQAMQMTATQIKTFKGCKVTAIAIPNGESRLESVTTKDITLFLGSEIKDGAMQYTSTFAGTMDLTKPYEYKIYPLPEPIEITADTKPFWAGFYCECNHQQSAPFTFDATAHSDGLPGGYFGVNQKAGAEMEWADYNGYYGFGCVRLVIEGTGMAANKVAISGDPKVPVWAAPNSDVDMSMTVLNNAYNTVESVTVTYTMGDEAEQTVQIPITTPLLYNYSQTVNFSLPMPAKEQDNLKVALKLTGVNGTDYNGASASSKNGSGYCLVLDPQNGVQKVTVDEEVTGTWCGWCPRGIVGLDKMHTEFPETFIPIAIHSGDEMSIDGYNIGSIIGSGAPKSAVNRDVVTYGVVDPGYESLKVAHESVSATPSCAKVEIHSMAVDGTTLSVNASVTPAIDLDGSYALAYVITEDQVGPYTQTNYYSPDAHTGMELEWWDTQAKQVEVKFDHVARDIHNYNGVSKSLPSQMTAGTAYTHTGTPSIEKVSKLENCHIIALLINRKTKRIENAVSVPYGYESSLPTVQDVEAPALYYDLQGRQVQTPANGIYIKKQGNKTQKIKL